MALNKTKVIRTDNDAESVADVLSKSDKVLKVAIVGTDITLTMYRGSKQDKFYVGNLHKLEFVSTGEEVR